MNQTTKAPERIGAKSLKLACDILQRGREQEREGVCHTNTIHEWALEIEKFAAAMQPPAPSAQVVEALEDLLHVIREREFEGFKARLASHVRVAQKALAAARQPTNHGADAGNMVQPVSEEDIQDIQNAELGFVPASAPAPVRSAEAQEGYRIYKNGNQWRAVESDFADLQTSPADFGSTPGEALSKLIGEWQKIDPSTTPQWVKFWLYREDVRCTEIGYFDPKQGQWLDWDTRKPFLTEPTLFQSYNYPLPPAPASEAEGR